MVYNALRARENILSRLNHNGVKGANSVIKSPDADYRKNIIKPKIAKYTKAKAYEFFKAKIIEHHGSYDEIDNKDKIVSSVTSLIKKHSLPKLINISGKIDEFKLSWPKINSFDVRCNEMVKDKCVGISFAEFGVAESGALFHYSSEMNPSYIAFLSYAHISVVKYEDIVASYEEAFLKLSKRFKNNFMKNSLNIIASPSKTADIEQTIFYGAHGPALYHVIILK